MLPKRQVHSASNVELWRGAARYASAIVRQRRVHPFSLITVSGVLSDTGVAALRHDVLAHLAEPAVWGVLVDLRKASLAIDDGVIPFELPAGLDANARKRPVAVVVPLPFDTLAQQWCWEMAALGLARGAFTDVNDAWSWLRTRAVKPALR